MGILATRILAFLGARFRFCQADAPELRVDKQGVGHHAALDGGVAIFDKVGAQDAEIVVGNVREGRAALDVAKREDAFHIGFQLLH